MAERIPMSELESYLWGSCAPTLMQAVTSNTSFLCFSSSASVTFTMRKLQNLKRSMAKMLICLQTIILSSFQKVITGAMSGR